ncbi:MAG TPA: hypothetical protein VMU39_03330 [Solirubrobacteraceae bacterium]|nr:hypothetical protein [Solirubrobacteraceae bacterium]
MTKDQSAGDRISAVVTGPVQGAVAIGKDISQRQDVGSMQLTITEAERAELSALFNDLRREVSAAVPESERGPALERVDELEQAIVADKPDLTTVQYVKQWFARKLPAAAGLITSVLVHPLVGRLVERAGDKLADQVLGEGA